MHQPIRQSRGPCALAPLVTVLEGVSLKAAEVRGKVTDEAGFPFPGAVVTVRSLPFGAEIFQAKYIVQVAQPVPPDITAV